MSQVLVKNKKYSGQYVALKSFKDSTIIAHGKTIKETYKKAQQKGYEDPVVTFLPPKDSVLIY